VPSAEVEALKSQLAESKQKETQLVARIEQLEKELNDRVREKDELKEKITSFVNSL
jgi:chromosome segregation ATPase